MEKIQQLKIGKLYLVNKKIVKLVMSKYYDRKAMQGYRPILKALTRDEVYKLYLNNLKGGAKQ